MIKKARAIVGHYNHSPIAAKRLETFQCRMRLPIHKLPQDCPTRWNSEFFMLQRLLEQKDAICAELSSSEVTGAAKILTANEWKLVGGLVKVLQPIAEATNDMSG